MTTLVREGMMASKPIRHHFLTKSVFTRQEYVFHLNYLYPHSSQVHVYRFRSIRSHFGAYEGSMKPFSFLLVASLFFVTRITRLNFTCLPFMYLYSDIYKV